MKWTLITLFGLFLLEPFQEDSKKMILGDWKGVSKVLIEEGDTVDYTLNQKGYKNDGYLKFKTDGILVVSSEDKTTYSIDGTTLRMGNRTYKIEIIGKDRLVISIEAMGEESRFWLGFERDE